MRLHVRLGSPAVVISLLTTWLCACALPHASIRPQDGDSATQADRVGSPDVAMDSDTGPQDDVLDEDAVVASIDASDASDVSDVSDASDVTSLPDADAATCGTGLFLCGGSCVDTGRNSMHCGACGNVCPAAQSCVSGACACPAGTLLCGSACIDTQSSLLHCGACGNACSASQVCMSGVCANTCTAPNQMCGGACVNPQNTALHCGRCNNPCGAGQVCSMGACVCTTGTLCGTTCIDTNSSNAHCGRCNNPCAAPTTCTTGMCTLTCPAGRTACSGMCVDTQTTNTHCGRCDNACAAMQTCTTGTCTLTCPAGRTACGGMCVDTTNNNTHCGACDAGCTPPMGGTVMCARSTCNPSCPANTTLMANICVPNCGNGVLDPSENCEDGNNANGDGCSASCAIEGTPFGDACASSIRDISISVGQVLWFRGNIGSNNNGSGSCSADGPEVVSSLRAVNAGVLTVRVTPATNWDVILRHNGGCPGTVCTDGAATGAAEQYTLRVNAGTNNAFLVDSARGTPNNSAFVARVQLMP
ncbi:MAG: MXAN_6577-like cysteine-rich protein [Deltaproteobacteria bacterium]|nr:MXAN_6577-like cysteine-rich protein [Deltaproteobacteria bacterium]